MNTLDKITNNLESFSKSERKVAEVILASPQTAIHSSIATLAKMADVSEPTVNRFCRRLDTKGFPDFKLHLAQSLANGTPYVNAMWRRKTGPIPIPPRSSNPPCLPRCRQEQPGHLGHQSLRRHPDPVQEDQLLWPRRLLRRCPRCPEQVLSLQHPGGELR